MSTNIQLGRPPSNDRRIFLRVLELDLDRHPTGRVITVPILSFERQRTIVGGTWRRPVLPARVEDGRLLVRCPYCGRTHHHGAVKEAYPIREAECGLGSYALRERARMAA